MIIYDKNKSGRGRYLPAAVICIICIFLTGEPGGHFTAYATEGSPAQEVPAPQQDGAQAAGSDAASTQAPDAAPAQTVDAPPAQTDAAVSSDAAGTAAVNETQQETQETAPPQTPAPAKKTATKKQTAKSASKASTEASSKDTEKEKSEEDREDAADKEDAEEEPGVDERGLPVGKAVYLTAAANVNLREKPSSKAGVLIVVPRDGELTATGLSKNDAGELWYEATYATFTGYVRDDVVKVREEDLPEPEPEELSEPEPILTEETEETEEIPAETEGGRIITRKPLGETLNTRRRWTTPEGYEPTGVGDRFSISKRLARREVDLFVIILAVIALAMLMGAVGLINRIRKLGRG